MVVIMPTTYKPFVLKCLAIAALMLSPASGAFAQAMRIIDGAAIGSRITDLPSACLSRVETVSLFVSNDDPADIDDIIYLVDVSDGTILSSFAAPGSHPQGLTTEGLGGDPGAIGLFVTEDDPTNTTNLIYKIDSANGTVLGSFAASGLTGSLSPRALVESFIAVEIPPTNPPGPCPPQGGEDITAAWIANGNTLCLIDLSDGSDIRSIPSPCGSPQGLEMGFTVLDTSELWVVCDDTDLIYLIDTADGSVIRSIPAPGDHSSGLALFGVRAATEGMIFDVLTLEIWQGENTSDTMEELSALDGSFIRRISPECVDAGAGPPIPTVSEWGLVVMVVMLLTAGTVILGRRRRIAVVRAA